MTKMCTVSRLERQFATLYLFHAPTGGGGLNIFFSGPTCPPRQGNILMEGISLILWTQKFPLTFEPERPQPLQLQGLKDLKWPKSRDATAMCDAIRIAHPQIASDATIFFFASDAKTHSLDLKLQENARKKGRENPAMLGCDAKNRGVFKKIERCEMAAIRTPAAVWPAMRAPAMPNR